MYQVMANKKQALISNAASMLGKKSAQARIKRWGHKEFQRRMREWGKLGGRPRKIKADKNRGGSK
jgi:hypothetical protein